MNRVFLLIAITSGGGALIGRWVARGAGRRAALGVWFAMFVTAYIAISIWYRRSGCDFPATVFVPTLGGVATTFGVAAGISWSDPEKYSWGAIELVFFAFLVSILPGLLFVMSLWPCR